MSDEPTATLQALRASTGLLLHTLDDSGWSDADARAPSRCDGWTRGHLLTHLARNADGVAATVSGALRNEVVPQYAPGARTRDIEAGAGRPLLELRADLADAAQRLDRVFAAVTEAGAWDRPADQDRSVRQWVTQRFAEVELHHVDLDAGYEPSRWPAHLISTALPDALASRGDGPTRVVVEGDCTVVELVGREWRVAADVAEVRGPDWAVLAWAVGRGGFVAGSLATSRPA